MVGNRYNLIDESWIPVVGKGKVGLRQIFADNSISALGGNPIEKIAVFKLLLAIAQSAYTPKDEDDWKNLGCKGLQEKVDAYLTEHYDCFWLYGEKPFLQMPAIEKAAIKSFGDVQFEIATGNTSVVTEIQTEKKQLLDAQKALIILQLMGFAFGGKKTDNSIVLSKGYTGKYNDKGKPASGKFGPSLGFMGFLHSFYVFENVINNVFMNLMTESNISSMKMYPGGVGDAPWLKMPVGEDDDIARKLKQAYMGRLIPLNRFVLIEGDGLHYSEGIAHPSYMDGVVDSSIAVDFSSSKPKILWVDPEKRPWRQLTSLLSFLDTSGKTKFECVGLKSLAMRLIEKESFGIWSGGVRVSSNAGEQYLTGTDDYVDSEIQMSSMIFAETSSFHSSLSLKMELLESWASKSIYGSVLRYYSDLMMEGKNIASKATFVFWQQCEKYFQSIVDSCLIKDTEEREKVSKTLENKIWNDLQNIYNEFCPNQTARQLESWAKNRPVRKRGA